MSARGSTIIQPVQDCPQRPRTDHSMTQPEQQHMLSAPWGCLCIVGTWCVPLWQCAIWQGATAGRVDSQHLTVLDGCGVPPAYVRCGVECCCPQQLLVRSMCCLNQPQNHNSWPCWWLHAQIGCCRSCEVMWGIFPRGAAAATDQVSLRALSATLLLPALTLCVQLV